ncbi:MAG: hypothetical protein H6Q85_2813, partial [candidate division NC10 bacterium]|nr:hypothetical protein [candidate division NC10 bacterium]
MQQAHAGTHTAADRSSLVGVVNGQLFHGVPVSLGSQFGGNGIDE